MSRQFQCCNKDDATEENQLAILAGQAALLTAIQNVSGNGGGTGDATEAKQDEILNLLKTPHVC